MKGIVLAAGYATRLYPLTKDRPKALLSIGKKTILDYIIDELETIDVVDQIIVISNALFYPQFETWKKSRVPKKETIILNDGSTSEENRLGAIGDILFAMQSLGLDDELFIMAGDTFFTYKLKDFYQYYLSLGKDCLSVKYVADKNMLKQFGVAVLDKNNKIVKMEEKPENPPSHYLVFASYILKQSTARLFYTYIQQGNKPDAPGYFLEWLYRKKDLYAFPIEGECYDIGTPQAYEEVQGLHGDKKN